LYYTLLQLKHYPFTNCDTRREIEVAEESW